MPITTPTTKPHSGRGPLAVLRRAKSVKKAGEKERDSLLEDAERLENWCGLMVCAGIALEAVIVLASFCWVISQFRINIEYLAADTAIGLGVYGEIRFGGVVGAILKLRLAEAKEGLEELGFESVVVQRELTAAIRQLAYLRTPRGVALTANADGLVAALLPSKGTDFDIGRGANDGEQADFVDVLVELLVRAEWRLGSWAHRSMGAHVIWLDTPSGKIGAGSVAATNVELHIHPEWEARLRPAADALAVALHDMDITATAVRYNCESANDGAVHILVGPKA